MQHIHDHLHHWDPMLPQVAVVVHRHILAKRLWRGSAEDGMEFGFNLEHHLHDGDVFFQTAGAVYLVRQSPESVLEINLASDPSTAARLGWMIGNLHFQLEVVADRIRVSDDTALRQMFEREHIDFTVVEAVFHPLSGGHHH